MAVRGSRSSSMEAPPRRESLPGEFSSPLPLGSKSMDNSQHGSRRVSLSNDNASRQVANRKSWHHGIIDRKTAESLLANTPAGYFLVRGRSDSKEHVLSVSSGGSPCVHYILTYSNNQFHSALHTFDTLPEAISFYMQQPLPGSSVKLLDPVPPPNHTRQSPTSASDAAGLQLNSMPQPQDIMEEDFKPKVFLARATQERTESAYDPTLLSFKHGDIISVKERNLNGTWYGECNGKEGHFPQTCVVELVERNFSTVP